MKYVGGSDYFASKTQRILKKVRDFCLPGFNIPWSKLMQGPC